MKLLYINNDGGGFADYIETAEGSTVETFFAERVPHGKPQDYLIRVNRQPAAADQALHEGDRVSFTPIKDRRRPPLTKILPPRARRLRSASPWIFELKESYDMKADQRALYRTAEAVRDILAQGARPAPFLREARWQELEKLARQIRYCRTHQFESACQVLETAWESELAGLIGVLNSQLAERRSQHPRIPAIREIYDDLTALGEEFEEVECDFGAATISVTTEAITLRGVYLGPFQICLDWKDLAERSPYRVIALDPHPAATNDAVTHPHVQDERLCEGDGHRAIAAALAQGRLGDFFQIVSQLLHTYAQGQAYVELARWAGAACSDCGAQLDDDERYYCDRCDADVCGECSASCERCGSGFCSECIKSCGACQQSYCESCLTACSGCSRKFCDGCLDERLCSACQAEQEEPNDEEEDHETKKFAESPAQHNAGNASRGAQIAVQPDGLGQAALFA